ncbi:hypothetical protein X975_10915, partial [Stegodyphus mimosarum]
MESVLFIEKCINILSENLKACSRKLVMKSTFKFYHDNYPTLTSLNIGVWLLYNYPKVISTPPYSPGLNPN